MVQTDQLVEVSVLFDADEERLRLFSVQISIK